MTTNTAATKAGEVTDAMVKAARVWLTHLHMKRQVDVDNAVRNAIEAALEAALPPPAEPASAVPAIDVTPDMVEKGCVAEIEHQKLPLDCRHYMRRANRIKAILEGALMGDPPMESADTCSCPQHGNWIAADDVKRLTRELDVALNGGSAAKQASLCDVVAQVMDERWKLVRTAEQSADTRSFQDRVAPWMQECFGPEISADRLERSDRFIEEALELVQACGYAHDRAHALVEYVFNRPIGHAPQEVGGVMVTLAALCLAHGFDMHAEGKTELARISEPEVIAKIRAKQAAKPTGSALPIAVEQPADTPSETMDWRRIANLLGEHLKKHSATYDCESCRRLIAKYDDAFALASRQQPARDGVSEATKILAIAIAHIAHGIPNAKEVAADALSQAAALEAAARVRADHFVDANKKVGDTK